MNPEPTEIVIGDTLSWVRRNVQANTVNDDGTIETDDILASEGWILKFVAVGRLGQISITATTDTEDTDDFIFTATAATTSAYVAGDYQWQIIATLSTVRYTIALGRVTCVDNIAARVALYDNRSHAKKVLDAIEAVLEGRASRTQGEMAYSKSGRSLQLTPIPELLKLRQVYKREYEAELALEQMKTGMGSGRKIVTRFVNAR